MRLFRHEEPPAARIGFYEVLPEIENLLELKEIHTGFKAEDLFDLSKMDSLKQVDFRFIDHGKGRIAAMRKQMINAEKEQLLYEHIPEEQRIPSMAHV
ncbi:hypothetical protein [Paenibacillus sp.]